MKKYGALIALVFAVLFGLLSVFLTNRWLDRQVPAEQTVIREETPMTKIVVAARNLEIGTMLSGDNLALVEWPSSAVPSGAFEQIEPVEGRVAVSRLVAGGPVLAAELARPGSGAGLVALITPGKRAMSIRVDEVIGVGGFIIPHTFVDVIGVEGRRGGGETARTILNKIKVLAIAQETSNGKGEPKVVRTVTLELKPSEAEKLALQTHRGSIHLVLRNPLDEEEPDPEPEPRIAAKPAPKPESGSVRTLQSRVRVPRTPTFEVELIQGDRNPEKFEFEAVQ